MRWLSGVLFLLASGCGGGLERVTFVTDRLEYAASDRVLLTLVNVGNAPVLVRLCDAVLEAERDRANDVGQPPLDCPAETSAVPPGERVSERRLLRLAITEGGPVAMRYRTRVTLATGDTEEVVTPVFEVSP